MAKRIKFGVLEGAICDVLTMEWEEGKKAESVADLLKEEFQKSILLNEKLLIPIVHYYNQALMHYLRGFDCESAARIAMKIENKPLAEKFLKLEKKRILDSRDREECMNYADIFNNIPSDLQEENRQG